jgi:hypothetical protein
MAKKTKNAFSKCVLELNFASNSGLYFFIFQKRSKSMYPNVQPYNYNSIGGLDRDAVGVSDLKRESGSLFSSGAHLVSVVYGGKIVLFFFTMGGL